MLGSKKRNSAHAPSFHCCGCCLVLIFNFFAVIMQDPLRWLCMVCWGGFLYLEVEVCETVRCCSCVHILLFFFFTKKSCVHMLWWSNWRNQREIFQNNFNPEKLTHWNSFKTFFKEEINVSSSELDVDTLLCMYVFTCFVIFLLFSKIQTSLLTCFPHPFLIF